MPHEISPEFRFSKHDCARRLGMIHDLISKAEFDALLVTDLVNLRYLSGFKGSSGYGLLTADSFCFITDGRYDEQCRREMANAGVEGTIRITGPEGLQPILGELIQEFEIRSLGLEAADVTWKQQMEMTGWFSDLTVTPTENLVESLRIKKEVSEIERIRAAVELGDAAFQFIIDRIHPGRTEIEIAREIERFMIDNGAEGISFEVIVASGPRSAMPHARPTESVLGSDEVVLMDFGCVVDGYCSDMTRTIFLGSVSEDLRSAYSVVFKAQKEGASSLRPGLSCKDADALCRNPIAEAGYGDAFSHSTGHGVGLEIHEEPRLSQVGTGILAEGNVVTVEPGIYLEAIGGVRIEDVVLVTENGSEVLTQSPRELINL